ncbi:MAG: SDR family NAD(P)-dependent oxidoreductase, partial [Paludibacteraceae bacterium]|nr:SDR family NAD(P)-dependent oxidoreductase [Paludibacteraceae bacterium]
MVIWITGASSGIGEACALEYARQSSQSAPMCLVLTASSVERLQNVADRCRQAGAEVRVVACDLKDAEQVATLTERVWDEFGRVDIAFLNAGISQRTTIEDTSMEMVRQIMEVNYFAPVAIAKDLLP